MVQLASIESRVNNFFVCTLLFDDFTRVFKIVAVSHQFCNSYIRIYQLPIVHRLSINFLRQYSSTDYTLHATRARNSEHITSPNSTF